ncbi:C2 family cysteine protease [Nocardia tengchongensis]|uniref:C2 family cysteine protease n=1 Tax=Nocardia tengchongensis TaxID=2055889 RepID=UPI0036C8907C
MFDERHLQAKEFKPASRTGGLPLAHANLSPGGAGGSLPDVLGMVRAFATSVHEWIEPGLVRGPTTPLRQNVPDASKMSLFHVDALGKPMVSSSDVIQEGLGDCYFVGAEAAVADKASSLILNNMIQSDEHGGYVVHMHNSFAGGEKVDVPVSASDVQALMKYHTAQQVLWPVVLEAAEAHIEARNGSDMVGAADDIGIGIKSLGEGGMPGRGLAALTGHEDTFLLPSNSGLTKVIDEVNTGHPVVMATRVSATPLGWDPHRDGLVDSHVYEVMSMHRDPDGTVWGLVNNPWQKNKDHGTYGDITPAAYAGMPGSKWVNLTQGIDHGGIAGFATSGSF